MRLDSPELDEAIQSHMQAHRIVGLSACRLHNGQIAWAKGYGWADIANHRPMTPDVIQNIGSISKTFTCTAILQLWEKGLFQLDDPVNEYLPFNVRHPKHENPITFRHLLTHTSAIDDSPDYPDSYACGDPTLSLGNWLQAYLLLGGKYYDAEKNFKNYAPGADWSYSNVAFGLLGYLCEILSDTPFNQYCCEHIFEPMGMKGSGWLLREIDVENHAVPYALPEMTHFKGLYAQQPAPGSSNPIPLCLYSFPNYPDGLVRTSARQLALYGAVFAASGERQGQPLLKAETVQRCFTQELTIEIPDEDIRIQGLTWGSRMDANGMKIWGHDGGDPGINTRLRVRPEDGSGIVILANTNHNRECMDALTDLVWQAEITTSLRRSG